MKTIERNWDALITAHQLAFGRLTPGDPTIQARAATRQLFRLLWDIVLRGPAAVAAWCHDRRTHAFRHRAGPTKHSALGVYKPTSPTPGAGRGVTPQALMLASGLDRAWVAVETSVDVATADREARERLTREHRPLKDSIRRELREFVHQTALRADGRHGRIAPLASANDHATLGYGRRVGGQRAAVADWPLSDGLRTFRTQHAAAWAVLKLAYRPFGSDPAFHSFGPDPTDAIYSFLARPGGAVSYTWGPAGRTTFADANPSVLTDCHAYYQRRMACDRAWHALLAAKPGARVDAAILVIVPGLRSLRDLKWAAAADVARLAHAPISQAREACRRVARQLRRGEKSVCELRTFANANGKIRNATVHPPEVVLAARSVSRWLLSRLRHIKTNSAILRNTLVRLHADEPAWLAYSADLKKASDHISCDTATMIIRTALLATNAPMWMVDAVEGLCGNMLLAPADEPGAPRGDSAEAANASERSHLSQRGTGNEGGASGHVPVTCGALMGLGPSWIAFSLMNDFAATKAGAPPESFAVNGDDLLGAWSHRRASRYERNIRDVGLIPNVKKSFRGDRGCFCEQLAMPAPVKARRPAELLARSLYRLGETCGAKSIEGRRGAAVCDDLRRISRGQTPPGWMSTHRAIRRLAGRTADRVRLSNAPGLLSQGGGGADGRANATTVAVFISGGSTAVRFKQRTARETADSRARLVRLLALPSDHNGPRLQEVAAREAARDNERADVDADDWRHRARAPTVSPKDLRKREHCRRVHAAKLGPFGALRSPAALSRWTAFDRARAHTYLVRGRYHAAAQYLASHTRRVEDPSGTPLFPTHMRTMHTRGPPNMGAVGRHK